MSIPPVLAEPVSSRNRTAKSERQKQIAPSKILETIEQHVLLDGFKVVVDLDKSRGPYLHNAVTNKRLIDLYGFFGSMPVGFNHPHFDDADVQRDLLRAAKLKSRTRTFIRRTTRSLWRPLGACSVCPRWSVIFSSRVAQW